MTKTKNIDNLYNLIGYVVLSAPSDFPVEDYLAAEDQMTLDKAFAQLRDGVEIAYPDDYYPEKKPMLYSLLDQAFAAYRAGEDVKGAHLLQDFQDNIFKQS